MFSATVNTGMSWKCWCTIPIPRAMASAELVNSHLLAVDTDRAGIGLVEPEDHVHQRRLARAVLAEQAVHLASAQVEVDPVVGEQAGEALGDGARLEDEVVGPTSRGGPGFRARHGWVRPCHAKTGPRAFGARARAST